MRYWHYRRLLLWISLCCITNTIQSLADEAVAEAGEIQNVQVQNEVGPEVVDQTSPTAEAPDGPLKEKRTVIVVAEKVDNPDWSNSWTPTADNTNVTATNRISNLFPPSFSNTVQNYPQSHYTKPSKKVNKSGSEGWGMENIHSRIMGYGKMMSKLLGGLTLGGHGNSGSFNAHSTADEGWTGGRGGIVNWISRIFGVDGKSLGEFLREYQVHVLYDLIFTFFKWIFFLYIGLLIP